MMADADIRVKDHAFNVGMAIDYGIPAALLYHDIDFWCQENLDKKQNIRDGCAWIVYTIAANNFIFDKSMPIHLTADELSRPFAANAVPSSQGASIRREKKPSRKRNCSFSHWGILLSQ